MSAEVQAFWNEAQKIDPDLLSPLKLQWVTAIARRLGEAASQTDFVQLLLEEVDDEYLRAMQRAVLDYKLLSPTDSARLGLNPRVIAFAKEWWWKSEFDVWF